MEQEEKLREMKSDREIFEILIKKEDYLPDVLEEAQREFQRRGLDQGELVKRREEYALHVIETSRAALSSVMKILFTLFPFGFLGFVFSEHYRSRGADRKSRDSLLWMWAGLGFWTLLVGALAALLYILRR